MEPPGRSGLRRPGVFAVAFAAVIIVGSITGAQLKQDKQKEETIKQFRAVVPAEQIRTLEEQRKVLMDQRGELQRKIDAFRDKVAERDQAAKR
ncbi:hypothetical protein NLU13_0181 [Sarocladium strictum]|uniref:Uncharacterized protein n=1 Tax=Sarocladium strictum TaxID=5046 RepID=A0AA39LB14_SARSR|nr:hypothetical protein NLU13_0181 [Sarocladium strictum]